MEYFTHNKHSLLAFAFQGLFYKPVHLKIQVTLGVVSNIMRGWFSQPIFVFCFFCQKMAYATKKIRKKKMKYMTGSSTNMARKYWNITRRLWSCFQNSLILYSPSPLVSDPSAAAASFSAPCCFLLMSNSRAPSGSVFIRFQASKRVLSCRLIPWTCSRTSPCCRPTCSAAPPYTYKKNMSKWFRYAWYRIETT